MVPSIYIPGTTPHCLVSTEGNVNFLGTRNLVYLGCSAIGAVRGDGGGAKGDRGTRVVESCGSTCTRERERGGGEGEN